MVLGTAVYSVLMAFLLLRMSTGSSPEPASNTNVSRTHRPIPDNEPTASRDPNWRLQTIGNTVDRHEPSKQQISSQHPQSIVKVNHPLSTSASLQYRQRCWKANYSSPDRQPVDHTPRPFLISAGPAQCRGDIFLLIFVQSAVQNRARRDLIRATWASVTNIGGDRLQTLFFVGRTGEPSQDEALRRESDTRADIVQADFVDSYRNLTYKHLYALKWIAESCSSVRYVMKVDDDVVVNVFTLRESLREVVGSRSGDFFYCQVSRVKPIRTKAVKWYVSLDEYPGDTYPDYCKGYGYVMNAGLIKKLHHCAKWRRMFWIDDVFVSGDLASALNAPRIQWEDGWGAKQLHPRLAGAEAAQMSVANAGGNNVVPSLHRRVWRAIVRFSDWGREDY